MSEAIARAILVVQAGEAGDVEMMHDAMANASRMELMDMVALLAGVYSAACEHIGVDSTCGLALLKGAEFDVTD